MTGMPKAQSTVGWWTMALLTFVLLGLTMLVGFYMLVPVDWDGAGKLGAIGLLFPLHLLALTIVSLILGVFARRAGAHGIVGVALLAALVSLCMALWPSLAMSRLAAEAQVELSLGDYLDNAWRLNRGTPRPELTQQYGVAADGTRLQLDVWPAEPDQGETDLRPAVVYVHGGAWRHGSRSAFPEWNRWLNDQGYTVFDVEYRLAPPARWRDAVGDVKCALGWVVAHAADYGIDPARIHLMGYSAGAHLAMLAAYSMGDANLPPSCAVSPVAVRKVINFYGPTDLERLYRTGGSPGYVRNALSDYLGGTPQQRGERYRLASPLAHITAGAPATLTLLGRHDRLVPIEQAELLQQRLAKFGVPAETWLLPAVDHGFDANWGGLASQFARARVATFLDRQ